MNLTPNDIKSFVNEPYFKRGREYFEEGLVHFVSIEPDKVKARALGSKMYEITLYHKNGKLSGNCTCPAFSDFGPCKHIAAAAFATIANKSKKYSESKETKSRNSEFENMQKLLMKKSKSELISIIMSVADENPWIFEDLENYEHG